MYVQNVVLVGHAIDINVYFHILFFLFQTTIQNNIYQSTMWELKPCVILISLAVILYYFSAGIVLP